MLKTKLTAENVIQFHTQMADAFDAKLILGHKILPQLKAMTYASREIGALSDALMLMGASDPVALLEQRPMTVTIPSERWPIIWVPWEPGSSDRPLAQQVQGITHECQHAFQAKRYPDWLSQYLSNFSARTRYETEAYAAEACIYKAIHGVLPSGRAMELSGYFLRPTDKEVLIKGVETMMAPLEDGARAITVAGRRRSNFWRN